MASPSDKQRVADYINPFAQPQPSEETGPGSHFGTVQKMPAVSTMPVQQTSDIPPPYSTVQAQPTGTSTTSTNTNPFRRNVSPPSKTPTVTSHRRNISNGGSPTSRTERFPSISSPYRHDAFGDGTSARRSSVSPHEDIKTRPRRVSSLNERFPGDPSVRPLDMLRHDAKVADRAPHLRKQHIPGADTVDRLDAAAMRRYHHEGPYDAVLLARNTSFTSSPVAAVENTNKEALRATPQENIRDSVEKHRPLDGVARVPSGEVDTLGRRYDYNEGPDLQREEGGDMGRWPGVDYHPDDVKGKGEPAFSIERAIKQSSASGKDKLPDESYIELVERPRKSHDVGSSSGSRNASPSVEVGPSSSSSGHHQEQRYADWEQGRRSRSGSKRLSVDLKGRIGSLRKRLEHHERDGAEA